MKCKCKDCTKRYLGCHSNCEDYKAYTEYRKELNNKEKLDKCTSTHSGWSYTGKRKKTND